jgi:hypothetical protein
MAAAKRLPAFVWSAQGPLPVTVVEDLAETEKAWGQFTMGERSIQLAGDASCSANRLQTLCHELIHLALWDSGVHHLLPQEVEEAVCDAVGSYLAGAARAGYLKFSVPAVRK